MNKIRVIVTHANGKRTMISLIVEDMDDNNWEEIQNEALKIAQGALESLGKTDDVLLLEVMKND